MAKSKYSPALFEVMNQTRNAQSKTSASKWWPFGRSAAVANDASPDALPVQDAVGQDANIPTRPASLSPSTSSQLAVPQAVTATAVADRAKSSGGAVANLESCPTNIPTSEAAATTGIPSLFGGSSAMPGGESNDSPPVELANATAGAFFGKTPTPAVNESVCQIDGGRVRISLNTVQAAIASTVLVVALVLSFGVGRLSARPKMPVSDDAIAQTPADTTSNGAGNAAASMGTHAKKHSQVKPVSAVDAAKRKESEAIQTEAAPPATTSEGLKAGWSYIVFDTYKKTDRTSAEFAQAWLAKPPRNIETILMANKDGEYYLLSKAGFNNPSDRPKFQQLADRVKGLGQEIKKEMIREKLKPYVFASPQIVQR